MLHNHATFNLPHPLQKKQFNNKSLLVYLTLQLIFCYTKAVLLLAKGERKVTSVTSRSNLRWLPVRISVWSDSCQRLSTLKSKYYQRLLPTQIHTQWAHQLMNLEWIFSHFLKTSDCVMQTTPIYWHVKYIWMTYKTYRGLRCVWGGKLSALKNQSCWGTWAS